MDPAADDDTPVEAAVKASVGFIKKNRSDKIRKRQDTGLSAIHRFGIQVIQLRTVIHVRHSLEQRSHELRRGRGRRRYERCEEGEGDQGSGVHNQVRPGSHF